MDIRKEPSLVIMAAGMGRRFGGFKQMAPVDSDGHIMVEYSLHDAIMAGFTKAVFVVSMDILGEFRERVGRRAEKLIDVSYAIQRIEDMPEGYSPPAGRTKPWGTAHAALAAKRAIGGNFAVINADDFYGAAAYGSIYAFLRDEAGDGLHALVGYRIENTLTENGYVSRGVCKTTDDGYLDEVVERTHIEPRTGGAAYIDNESDIGGGVDGGGGSGGGGGGGGGCSGGGGSGEGGGGDGSGVGGDGSGGGGGGSGEGGGEGGGGEGGGGDSGGGSGEGGGDSAKYVFVPNGTVVSMNMWGFGLSMMGEIERRFAAFLDERLPTDPLKCEYFLPLVPNQLLRERKARIKVLPTPDRWYGVTYMDDLPAVREAIEGMRASGTYPRRLLENRA